MRILTLPHTHPLLHEIITQIKNNPPRTHASPIANLIRIVKLSRTNVETILPSAQCMARKPTFTINVPTSRKESIKWEKNDEADYKVYSDGSGVGDGIGAAAIFYAKGRNTPKGQLKAFLGTLDK